MPDNEMIERVARALTLHEGSDPDGPTTIADRPKRWMLVIEDARAAIEAMREPTEAMVAHAHEEFDLAPFGIFPGPFTLEKVWRAMVDEALK